jgi:hypothetical protein
MQPNEEELRLAFKEGFLSIDEGDTFYAGFYDYLGRIGYQLQQDGKCTCSDGGAHGHLPECRWVKL